jgi:hypothetical protein
MSMLELRHYQVRFHASQRLRYRLLRLVWRLLIRRNAIRPKGGSTI